MIFVDTNVFMYAVGRPHPLRTEARAQLSGAVEAGMGSSRRRGVTKTITFDRALGSVLG